MEMAQFGDTEVNAAEIKSVWQQLTDPNSAGKKLELEFARLANMVDDRKALSVGTSEQNRAKNQSDTVVSEFVLRFLGYSVTFGAYENVKHDTIADCMPFLDVFTL